MTRPAATLADTWQASVEKLPYSPIERGLWDMLRERMRAGLVVPAELAARVTAAERGRP